MLGRPSRPRRPVGLALAILAGAVLAGGPGCASRRPVPDWVGSYPSEATQARTLDVQVFREGRTMRFTNTTARDIPPGRIWINQWFSRPIERPVAVGETLELDLSQFRDEFGERFRAGGFWATEEPDVLALVQYEMRGEGDEPQLWGMVVVNGGER